MNATWDRALSYEGALSLPLNYTVIASHEPWIRGLKSDQMLSSIALGYFWPQSDVTYMILGGYGWGSHRVGPDYRIHNPFNDNFGTSYTGHSDFRKYFLQGNITMLSYSGMLDSSLASSSLGFAGRLEYLDRHLYSLSSTPYGNTLDSAATTIDLEPKRSIGFDIVMFGSIGIEYAQLYAQLLVRLPKIQDTGESDLTGFVFATGFRLAF
jgi:hypothetical protein